MQTLKYTLFLFLLLILVWAMGRLFVKSQFDRIRPVLYIIITSFIVLEIALNLFFRWESGAWMFAMKAHPNRLLFEEHPYLAVSNQKSIERDFRGLSISHDAKGNRNTMYNLESQEGKTVIVAIGGSTTYGVGVSDQDSWPYMLDSMTGIDTVVINLAVPGHSTVEHLIQASLYLDEYHPDMVLIHAGLNDLRVSNVQNLQVDYRDFHEGHLVGSMGLCYLEALPKVASIYYLVRLMQGTGMYPVCDFHKSVAQSNGKFGLDPRALYIYEQNLSKLFHIAKKYTHQVIFIPQVLNEERVGQGGLQWWIPFVQKDQLYGIMNTYNERSRIVADSSGVEYLENMTNFSWTKDYFVDPSHLNAQGNLRFASEVFKRMKPEPNDSTNTAR